jgi:phosphoribosylaminoimidazole-succinocarboxamide synthase
MSGDMVIRSDFSDLKLFKRGKVRDVYEVDGNLLIVASDRMSAFDVVMDDPIPDKGRILTAISLFWFEKLKPVVENHIISANPSEYPVECRKYRDELEGRSMLVKKAEPLPVECIVRGYVSGSGWIEYQEKGSICGIPLPEGLNCLILYLRPPPRPKRANMMKMFPLNPSVGYWEGRPRRR